MGPQFGPKTSGGKGGGAQAPLLDPPLKLAYAISRRGILELESSLRFYSPFVSNETNRGYAHNTVKDANTRPRLSTSLLKLGLVRALGLKNSPAFDKMERRGMRVMNF